MKKILSILFFSVLLLGTYSVVNAYTIQSGDSLSKISQKFGLTWQELWKLNPQIANPNLIFSGQELKTGGTVHIPEQDGLLGGTLPVAGTNYTLAGSGITSSANSITLQSLTIPQTGYKLQDSDFSSTFYVTLEPGNTKRQEISSCTTVTQNANNTATLSGCSRGLAPIYPYTASTTYAFPHAGGTSVIFSDAPQLFNEFTAKSNNETITGTWTYNIRPNLVSDTDTTNATDFVTLGQLSRQAISGASNAATGVKGIVQIPIGTQIASSTSVGSTGALLVVPTSQTTSSPYSGIGAGIVPATKNNGKLEADFIDQTEDYTWSGTNNFSGLNTFSATTTLATSTIASSTINNLNVPSTSTSTLSKINTDYIGPSNTTTTLYGDVRIKGNYTFDGSDYGNGIKWEYLSTAADADGAYSFTDATGLAKAAVIIFCHDYATANSLFSVATIFKNGYSSGNVSIPPISGSGASNANFSWSGATVSGTATTPSGGGCVGAASRIYFYK